jgi:hypothetical protein
MINNKIIYSSPQSASIWQKFQIQSVNDPGKIVLREQRRRKPNSYPTGKLN